MAGVRIGPPMALPSEIGLARGPSTCRPKQVGVSRDRRGKSAAEFDVWETAERLVPRKEPRTGPAGCGVADGVHVRQLWASELQGHRLEQPFVLGVDDDGPKSPELSLGVDLASIPEYREI